MKERPMLMSAPMVRAILAGTKTQTRRVVKPASGYAWLDIDAGTMINNGGHKKHISDLRVPYGQPGDRLWVRETWAYHLHAMAASNHEMAGPWVYAADGEPAIQRRLCDRWRPSIHMPRAASRILLEVTAVRVERLQDISEADAIAEGIERWDASGNNEWADYSDPAGLPLSARESYRTLWDQINGPGSWDANPWVWVVEFKRVTP